MPRVLVIDDEPQIRSLVKRFLSQAGYDVDQAGDGLDGVKEMKENPADLMITDILMPKKEGLETIREIYPECKTIAMSGGSQLTAIDFQELVDAVKELVPVEG